MAGVDASLANTSIFFTRGQVPAPFKAELDATVSRAAIDGPATQEGAALLTWSGKGTARIAGPSLDLSRETNADLSLQVTYRVQAAAKGDVRLSMGGGAVPARSLFATPGAEWRTARVPLKCLREAGADMSAIDRPFVLTADAGLSIAVADVRLTTAVEGATCPK